MDDRILRELIYLARSNDPVALRSLYVYYDALVNTVMRKMKYVFRSTGFIAGRVDYF